MKKRDKFTGGIGFVLAAAGSAVGLGNIWRFPYLAARYGGGLFLFVYLIFVVTFGFSLMIAENAIGRKTGKSELEAFSVLNKKWGFIGVLSFIVPCVILPYYNVIGGWVIKYLVGFISGAHTQMSAVTQDGKSYFETMLASPAVMIFYQFLFNLSTTVIIVRGIQKGIEKISTILMPILVILAVIISIYSMTLPGAMEGVKYFLIPNMKNFSVKSFSMTLIAAMGQMFFSMSLAMGIMIAYGSYLPKDSDLEKSVTHIEIFDTGIAVLAGLMIIPAVFAFSNGDPDKLNAGPTLMFVTLPQVFEKMGMSTFIGITFFLLVLFAALTSSVSVMEAIVSAICDKTGWKRSKVAIVSGILSFLAGLLPALGFNVLSGIHIGSNTILDIMDFVTNSILMPITAFLTCIFVGWVIGVGTIDDEVELSGRFKRKKLFHVMIKYIAPVLIIVVLVSSILSGLGIIKI